MAWYEKKKKLIFYLLDLTAVSVIFRYLIIDLNSGL